jgi:hypothetical protein
MTIPSDSFIEKLREKSTEQLLHMRAEGDMLADEWHELIELVLLERGEHVPPIPQKAILIPVKAEKTKGDGLLFLGFALFILVVGKMVAHTFMGIFAGACVMLYFLIRQIRRGALTEEQRDEEDGERLADKDELNELMRTSANGQMSRVKELLAFRAIDVNARTPSGSTALFYAARNGHADIADLLMCAGADLSITNEKGATAADVARRFGHVEMIPQLSADVVA